MLAQNVQGLTATGLALRELVTAASGHPRAPAYKHSECPDRPLTPLQPNCSLGLETALLLGIKYFLSTCTVTD